MSHSATNTVLPQLDTVVIMYPNSGLNHLVILSNELLLKVLEEHGLTIRDIVAFAATSRQNYDIATPVLYKKHIREEDGIAILWAVSEQRINTLARLVENGINVNGYLASSSISRSFSRYRWVARLVISTAPDGTFRSIISGTSGSDDIRLLVQQRHAVSTAQEWLFAPLALAVRKGCIEAAKWLLDHGARVDAVSLGLCNDKNNTQYTSRGMWRLSLTVTGALWGPNTFYDGNTMRWTPLHLAIRYGHMAMVCLLVSRSANPLQVCGASAGPCTALHSAAIHRHYALVEHLLESGLVCVDAQGYSGITILHLAYCLQDCNLLKIALRYRACLNKEYDVGGNKWTIFAMACTKKDMFFALKLLKMGANPNFSLRSDTDVMCSARTILQSHRDANQITPLFSLLDPNGNEQSIQAVEDELNRIEQGQTLLMVDHQASEEE